MVGKTAGYIESDGRHQIRVDGKLHRASRLAWMIYYGKMPDKFIDHINGNPSDNRICNLREATILQNRANVKIFKNNQSGFKGVYFDRQANRYKVTVIKDRKKYHAGSFLSKEEAAEAYMRKASELFGEFACNGI